MRSALRRVAPHPSRASRNNCKRRRFRAWFQGKKSGPRFPEGWASEGTWYIRTYTRPPIHGVEPPRLQGKPGTAGKYLRGSTAFYQNIRKLRARRRRNWDMPEEWGPGVSRRPFTTTLIHLKPAYGSWKLGFVAPPGYLETERLGASEIQSLFFCLSPSLFLFLCLPLGKGREKASCICALANMG